MMLGINIILCLNILIFKLQICKPYFLRCKQNPEKGISDCFKDVYYRCLPTVRLLVIQPYFLFALLHLSSYSGREEEARPTAYLSPSTDVKENNLFWDQKWCKTLKWYLMALVFPLRLLNGICSVRFVMGVKNVSQTHQRKIKPAPSSYYNTYTVSCIKVGKKIRRCLKIIAKRFKRLLT